MPLINASGGICRQQGREEGSEDVEWCGCVKEVLREMRLAVAWAV